MPLLQYIISIPSRLTRNESGQAYHGAPTLWLHISSRPVCILHYSVFISALISVALNIILNGKYVKFFPIYENFFKNFSVKADVSTRLSFEQTTPTA